MLTSKRKIPYQKFKMDLMVKIDLKDAYYVVPLNQKSRKYVRFLWEGSLYEFICLMFGLGPCPRIFTKLLRIPITILRRLNIRMIIYIDDMLIIGSSMEEILMARDTVLHLLEALGFVINYQKSMTTPTTEIEFLGVIINSNTLTLSIPLEKLTKLTGLCQRTLNLKSITIRDLAKLIGKLRATSPAFTPAPLQLRNLQREQMVALNKNLPYEAVITLKRDARLELHWWIENISIHNGKAITMNPPELMISSDASMQGWGAACQEISTGGEWSQEQRLLHINMLELIAVEYAIKTFTRDKQVTSIHLQIDNTCALAYLVNMGGGGQRTQK